MRRPPAAAEMRWDRSKCSIDAALSLIRHSATIKSSKSQKRGTVERERERERARDKGCDGTTVELFLVK